MWFWGLLLGAAIGAATFSLQNVVVYAALGALGLYLLGPSLRRRRAGDEATPAAPRAVVEPTLHERVLALEERVALLERRARDHATSTTAAAPDVALANDRLGATPTAPDPIASSGGAIPAPAGFDAEAVRPASGLEDSAIAMARMPAEEGDNATRPDPSVAPGPSIQAPATLPGAQDDLRPDDSPGALPAPASRAPRAPRPPLRDRLPAPLARLIFGGNLLVKAGVLILFLGLAFLLRYTAERVTVPVELRYAMVAGFGALLLAVGWRLRRRRADYALTLQGAGIGALYLTTLAAMKLQPLLAPGPGFAFLFAVAVLSALLAVLQNAPALAIVAALEGFAAPVLAASGSHDALGLYGYLLVLDLGILVVAWFQAWRLLNLIGAVGTFTLASGWAHRYYQPADFGVVQTFLVVFFVLFAAIGLLFARRTLAAAPDDAALPLVERARRSLARVGRVDSALVFGVPMAAFGLEYLLVRPHDLGPAVAALAFGAFYLGLGRFVVARQPRGLALLAEAYAIVGAIFVTLAIPLALEGQWTGSAWAIEAAGMYWLGQRQQRPYARGFAFVLLLGAAIQLLRSIGLDMTPGTPALRGTLIGPLLVAAGAFAVVALQRRAATAPVSAAETIGAAATSWLGLGALALLPWQILPPAPACAVTAWLGLAAYAVALRSAVAPLAAAALTLQAAMLAGFVATLRAGVDPGGAALAGGRAGLVSALALALALLASGALAWRRRLAALPGEGVTMRPSRVLVASTLGGITLLHLALLLGADWRHAAFWWTFGGAATLWLALRLRLPSLAGLAAAIHLAASTAVLDRPDSIDTRTVDGQLVDLPLAAFAHLGFWTALALGVTALLAADRLRAAAAATGAGRQGTADVETPPATREAGPSDASRPLASAEAVAADSTEPAYAAERTGATDASDTAGAAAATDAAGATDVTEAARMRPAADVPFVLAPDRFPPRAATPSSWLAAVPVRWLPLLWGLGWWGFAWGAETLRVLAEQGGDAFVPAAWIGIAIATAALARVVSIRRHWHELALADTLAPLPVFVAIALVGVEIAWPDAWRPAAAFGWLAWPLALAWHLFSLRRRIASPAPPLLAALHVAGLWFFTALAARECEVAFSRWGDAWSAWPLLGWALVPALVVAALASRRLARRWPLAEQRSAYLGIGLAPIAVILIGWVWATNLLSPGDAAPLPYLPLLNPLELAQALVGLALLLAWRALPASSAWRRHPRAAGRFAAVTGWALLTGLVLRSCHHLAGVPWSVEALFASRLTEAALSIAWATCGVLAMGVGHRRASRGVWIGGAVLLGIVVVKLFLIELADQGGLFRIVSFVGVGVLLLAVGYFAPVPPGRPASKIGEATA